MSASAVPGLRGGRMMNSKTRTERKEGMTMMTKMLIITVVSVGVTLGMYLWGKAIDRKSDDDVNDKSK